MEAEAPGVLCLQSLRIAGLRQNVLASLIVTASARAADQSPEQPVVLLSSLAALIPSGTCTLSAVLTPRNWPVLQPLVVAEGAASANLHHTPVPLRGHICFEVSRGQVKKGKLRAVKLFSCRLRTSDTCTGCKTFAGHSLEEVHPQLDRGACMQLQLGADVSRLPLCSASVNLPACASQPAKLLKLGLPRSGTDPCLSQLPFKIPAKAHIITADTASSRTPPGSSSSSGSPNPFPSPVSHAELIATDAPSPRSSDTSPQQTVPQAAHAHSTSQHVQQQQAGQLEAPIVTYVSAPPQVHRHMPTPFAEPAQFRPSEDGGRPPVWQQRVCEDSLQQADKIGTSPATSQADSGGGRVPKKGVRASRSMADLHADQVPELRRRPVPALLSVGARTYSTPLESAMSLRCRTHPAGGSLTVPNSPIDSSSSGELDCSAPNTPSYPRPEATFDWSFQADRQALLGQMEEDELHAEAALAVGQRQLVPPLLSDACATAMDGARLIKWMSSCWWMSLV